MYRLTVATSVVLSLLLIPASASAQRAKKSAEDEVCAWPLALAVDHHSLVAAAGLYRREAARLDGDDPQATACLTVAGRLLHHAERYGEAREVMEEAAGVALAQGDVVLAARMYVHAALAAQEDAQRLVEKAETLASSPLLPPPARAAIVALIGGDPGLRQ